MAISKPTGAPGMPQGMSMDLRSLDALKAKAGQDPKAAATAAAKQLESLFMQELMKSMRNTTLKSDLMENSGSEMGTEMLDGEFAQRMSGLPNGLSSAIVRQLERSFSSQSGQPLTNGPDRFKSRLVGDPSADAMAPSSTDLAATSSRHLPASRRSAAAVAPAGSAGAAEGVASAAEAAQARATTAARGSGSKAEDFVRRHTEAAKAAEAVTGIPAAHVIGQAALESGWGRREIRNADGSTTHNIFGIKAGAGWTGKVAEVTTTEYVNGVPRRVTAKFRSYDSYEEAFVDHANLLKQSARYQQVIEKGKTAQGYAQGLQRAGYATDPAYAHKLASVINTTLRLQRAVT
ncbi:MAG: flagellar assembly peptidoglycan hydrolase FlgJ [Aquabacterium sp.]|nr:MAG: flagellar assembly peptidoglycan hydrolase FlgJ [Aquabacterium sp.]